MRIYTIGFSGKSAQEFFTALQQAGVQKLIDVRRSNNTLFCGFTRARDLPYFLTRLCAIPYVYEPEFAPSEELLRDYQVRIKKNKKDSDAWPDYVRRFHDELKVRPVLDRFHEHANGVANVCLLCAEPTAEQCHRRLLAEYVRSAEAGAPIEIVHL